ncbi:hypothetical protein NW762_014204 [Fusarium torreyae]|uniref:Uncharacterized protein n=1 Tax=Fusarium torreyae TaxID=1237075 RepID=A0A9W8V6X9_9HYPO|nr:hypothetical protein NW762_014204 [Fusarium torreyae]
MPPKKTTNAQNKRPHDEAADSQRSSKIARTNDAQADEPSEEQWESSQARQGSRQRRIPKGPKGESMMPQFMPRECAEAKVIENLPMPSRWVVGIDAIPDRSMTLGSRKWWEDHGPWLEAHKKQLKLSAANWKMKDEAMKQDGTIPDDEGNDDWDFTCHPVPNADRPRKYEDEEEEEEEEEGEGGDKEGEKDKEKDTKPYEKLASLHPEWPWFFTMLGQDRFTWWEQEALKRDQDDFQMHIYNDFTAYVCDDPQKCEKLSEMVGYLILAVIDALKKQDVFKPDSEIRNLGLVLAMFVKWGREQATEYEFNEACGSWIYKVIELAEGANVHITGPDNFEETYDKILSDKAKKAKAMKRWDNVNWASKVKAYTSKRGKLGGNMFDITKFSPAERKKYSFASGGGIF